MYQTQRPVSGLESKSQERTLFYVLIPKLVFLYKGTLYLNRIVKSIIFKLKQSQIFHLRDNLIYKFSENIIRHRYDKDKRTSLRNMEGRQMSKKKKTFKP